MELLTFMEPLCASMIWRVMASPRPVPSGLKVLKGVKISGSCSGEIPHPLSSTEMRSLPAEQLAWNVTFPFGKVMDSAAFRRRFRRACFIFA